MTRIATVILWLFLITAATCAPKSKNEDSFATLEKLLATKFPKSALVVFYNHTVGLDDTWLAKVTLSRSDLEDLLKTEPFKKAKWKSGVHTPSIPESWWKPRLLAEPFSSQIRLQGAKGANVVYGHDSSNETWVLYLQIFET